MKPASSRMKLLWTILFRTFRFFVVIAVAAGLALVLFKLKREPEKKLPPSIPPSVSIIKAAPVSTRMNIEAFGTIEPRHLVNVAVEVSGRIETLHPFFVAGGVFKKGDLLVKIDERSYRLNRDTAQTRLLQAQSDLESLNQEIENLNNDLILSKENATLAGQEFERVRALTQNEFASKTSLDKAKQQYLQAKIGLQGITNRLALTAPMLDQKKAAVKMAGVELEKAQLALEKTRIFADFDGYVLNKTAETGEVVNPGQVIGTIFEKGKLDVDISIPVEQIKWLDPSFFSGKYPEVLVESTTEISGSRRPRWQAQVARLKARIDEKTRTLPMTVEIMAGPDQLDDIVNLKPGAFVRCTIMGRTVPQVYILPRHLLKHDNTVFIVENGRLKIKPVGILRKFEDNIYIDEGLNPGDQIITSPLPGALGGMVVKIIDSGK